MLTGPDDVLHQSFVDFVTNQGLSQLINFPTRGLNVLDILLTDADHIVTSVQCLPPFGGSDHIIILSTCSFVCLSVRSFVRPLPTCERYIL